MDSVYAAPLNLWSVTVSMYNAGIALNRGGPNSTTAADGGPVITTPNLPSTFEGQPSPAQGPAGRLAKAALPSFSECFVSIADFTTGVKMRMDGVSIYSEVVYQERKSFLGIFPYWGSDQTSVQAVRNYPLGELWPYQSESDALNHGNQWSAPFFDTTVDQVTTLLGRPQ
jgi:hypothetical protein